MLDLPTTSTLSLRRDGWRLYVTLDRPEARNAMSAAMAAELRAVADAVDADPSIRAVILRGAGGTFCAGGDIKDMARARAEERTPERDPIAELNRSFGATLERLEGLGAAVIAVVEGVALGGGFGLACVADVTLCARDARFRLPETGLGITPAQIAPFLVRRMGLTQARRLAVTGASLDAEQSVALGIAHAVADDVDAALQAELGRIARCAPGAVASTKRLMLRVGTAPLGEVLDAAAADFAERSRGDEAAAGFAAFLGKTSPPWVGS